MRRRDLLVGSAAVAAANAAPFSRFAALAAAPNQLIDVHCHIFNADDLPVVGFVEKAILNEHPDFREAFRRYRHAADFFVRFLADWLQGKAFSAQKEIAHLDLVKADPSNARTPGRIREDEIRHLTDFVTKLSTLRLSERDIPLGERIFGFFVPGVVIGLMHREAFPILFPGDGVNDNSDGAFSPQSWQPPTLLAQRLYDEGKGQVSRYLRWGLRFTRYRSELGDELGRIHGGRARLVTPALIDYSLWLNDSFDVKLARQVAVMGRIARQPGDTRVHCFAPFDPLREALHRIAPQPDAEAPFELVKRAVNENGFVGVKLYPPMGFRPLANARFAASDFPRHVRRRFGNRRIGADLDAVLSDLYTWCVSAEVPILAHASNSNGSAPGFSARANPDNWAPVIKAFPGLRLALAHFGDFDEGFQTAARPDPKLTDTWEWKMAKLINDHPNSLVFADLSYFRAAMMQSDHEVRKEVARMFGKTMQSFPLLPKRLIFGSDWMMLGQEERFGRFDADVRYASRVDDLLGGLNIGQADRDAIMFANSSVYLGLDKAHAAAGNRVRLKKFYADHGLSDAWLDRLIA